MSSTSEFPPPSLRSIVTEVTDLLRKRGETVSIAETAAGGIISASILATPGASKLYKGGLTVYTLESRLSYAGWTQANIDAYAGPTPEVVSGIAVNVRNELGSTYTICESGTAGPTPPVRAGGENREPGYVALAVSGQGESKPETRTLNTGTSDREVNMVRFAEEALKLLRDVIAAKDGGKL